MVESDKKRNLILDGAIKRFSHFGINKTTMTEIAEDLSVTKPALYYYFPDKQSIVIAVAEKIVSDYIEKLEAAVSASTNTEEALISLIDIRRSFSQKYFMLHIGEEFINDHVKDPALTQVIQGVKGREVAIVANKLKEAIAQGELIEMETTKTAELYVESINGLAVCMKMGVVSIPDQDAFEVVSGKQKDLAAIFLNGLRK